MITEKRLALKPILESAEGIHFTAYVVNRGNLIDLKNQLRIVLEKAEEKLESVLSIEERQKFFEPIEGLLKDSSVLKKIKGHIALFRNKDIFRVLSLPITVENECHVATSFHVKPLLRWLQFDRDFLVLGLSRDSAHLYLGNQSSVQKIDSILFPDEIRYADDIEGLQSLETVRKVRIKLTETFSWLSNWLDQVTNESAPPLFLAGEKYLVKELLANLKYKNVVEQPVLYAFGEHNLTDICLDIRRTLRARVRKDLQRVLYEFKRAEEVKRGKRNIFQIAKAAMKGKVKKLIIAEDLQIFGKIDRKTGGLAIHPFDLDHEDDDLLDDLAQAVLASGGEVFLAPRAEIPKGHPILAILSTEGEENPAVKVVPPNEGHQHRIG